jgi:glycosyltransferase involved in cell wall biosynthesis
MSKLKLALLSDGIYPFVNGGMQQHSSHLSKYLTLNNVEVTLVHCVYSDKIPQDSQINHSLFGDNTKLFKIITIKFPKSIKFPGHYLFNSWRYSKLVFENLKKDLDSFDFFYVKGFSGWKLLNEKRKGLIIPSIGINFHGMNMFLPVNSLKLKLSNFIFRPFVKYNINNSDYVISYGGKVTTTIINIGIPKEKVIEIPTGIEKEFILKESSLSINKKLKFLFVGRYDPLKGISEIFKSLKIVNSSLIDFAFIGPIPQKVIQNNIKYYGFISNKTDIFKIMDQCDVLVLPSYSEGMPNVILEAMARGLIIIASDVGAINLMVSNKNGILLKNQNHKSLLKAINSLILLNPVLLSEMKHNSIKKINNSFSWDIVSKQLIYKIENLVS